MRWSAWPGMLAVLVPVAAAAGTGFRFAPEPAWVTPAAIPAVRASPADSSLGALEILVDDRQQNTTVDPREDYRHLLVRVVNEQGVDGASQFELSFDPSYQELLVHRIRVHRGSKTVDQRDGSHMRVIQRETRLENRVYDGALSVLVVLDDVRAGDVVELSSTVRGANPALAGHFGDGIDLTGDWRPGAFRRRLLWKADRPLTIRNVGTELRPQVMRGATLLEYLWTPERPVRADRDGDLPSWYLPGPFVVLSSFQSWNEVARWGANLFQVRAPTGAVRDKVAELRARHPLAHDQALAAIRFVEDDVRYLSNVFGEGSYRPSDPNVVMRRRFGDCKDKVLTLVSILRGLDIRADPALVSTGIERKLLGWMPDIKVFDHAIVRIQLEGRTYWIDPTRQGQRGASLSRLHIHDFGYALVLDPAETGLSAVHTSPEAEPRTTIHKSFDCASADSAARLTVETVHVGGAAESARVLLSGAGREDLQHLYLRYYARLYPEIAIAAPLEISDDEMLNHVRIVESYSVPNLWRMGPDSSGRRADLTAFEVQEYVGSPQEGKRSMPIGVTHPLHVVCETRVVSPEGWNVRPESLLVVDEAVRFRYRAWATGSTLTLYHEFETLADSVSAAGGEVYLRDLDRIRDALAFHAVPGGAQGDEPLPWEGMVIAMVVAGGCWVPAVRIYRRRPVGLSRIERFLAGEHHPPPDAALPAESDGTTVEAIGAWATDAATIQDPPAPLRIGGWLVLFAIGAFVVPIVSLFHVIESAKLLGPRMIGALLNPWDQPFHALTPPLTLFEAASKAILFVGSLLILALFVARRRSFPRVWIGVALLELAAGIGSIILSAPNPDIAGPDKWNLGFEWLTSTVKYSVWSLYLARSRRVRQTFVR